MRAEHKRGAGLRADAGSRPNQERWLTSLNENLSDHIRLLAQRRHTAFGQAATHRREGQLVPGSVTQELTENASDLRGALERYAEATR